MKKVNVTVSYDDEKLSALRLYLGQKNSTVEAELVSALDALYGKTVPANVREFIDMKSEEILKPKKQKVPLTSGVNNTGKIQQGEQKKDENRE